MTSALQDMLEFALQITHHAGRLTLGHFHAGVAVERKSDNSPVTIADKNAEGYLRRAIAERFPDHGIIGEEYGTSSGSSSLTWVLDPIDGTKSFIHGVPLYSNLVALVDNDLPEGENVLVGVANFPALGDTIYASRGGGAFWNGRRAHCSDVSALSEATLLFSDVTRYGGHQPAFEALIAGTYIQRTWGDSYGYALVATGRADVMLDPIMNIWDCAPFGVILPEAGGTFTDWQGRASIAAGESIATNSLLLETVLALTRTSTS